MTGYYFINTDLRNPRAHTSQVLHTAAALGAHTPLVLVAPRFPGVDMAALAAHHGLAHAPRTRLLPIFGLRRPGILAFILFNLPAMLFLTREALRGKVGFIYVRATYFLPLAVYAWVLRIPLFYETHRKPVSWPERLRDRLFVAMARGVVVVSARVKKEYAHAARTVVVHDAVDLKRFAAALGKQAAREGLGVAPQTALAVYTGSVSRLKGLHYVYAAAEALPHVQFVCAGRVVGDAGEPPANVQLLGHRDQGELPALLRAADVLVLPHPDNDFSQSPLKLFEYMASGTPIVSTRLASICEVLTEHNSFLVAPNSADALAAGITEVLEDPAGAAARAAVAREDVAAHTWEARGKTIAEFIHRTIYG